jgi:energy-coupling factor transporter ATP-binding protein EcfA2
MISGAGRGRRTDDRYWHAERMTDQLAIRLRGVVKRYGPITAVNGLDLDVPTGTCVGLLGPNGAGKSTTMRLLTAQSIADEGELEVLGFTYDLQRDAASSRESTEPAHPSDRPKKSDASGTFGTLSESCVHSWLPEEVRPLAESP